jgi:hypothetical protein
MGENCSWARRSIVAQLAVTTSKTYVLRSVRQIILAADHPLVVDVVLLSAGDVSLCPVATTNRLVAFQHLSTGIEQHDEPLMRMPAAIAKNYRHE